jgi:predicted nucleotidyltransferase component of viral defense system
MPVRDAIELFHLVFLAELGRRLPVDFYALKGGCNLRFFFLSPRYSEDLDLDVGTVAQGTLRTKVTKILDSRSLHLVLGAKGLRLVGHRAPKQTETTQRWKVELEDVARTSMMHTKIEFSRRGRKGDTAFEPVDPLLLGTHDLPSFFLPHYTVGAAFTQKVSALAGRSQTQARDVFDLDLLLRGGALPRGMALPANEVAKARAHAAGVTADDFRGQVLAFLPADHQVAFRGDAAWEAVVRRVVDALGAGLL